MKDSLKEYYSPFPVERMEAHLKILNNSIMQKNNFDPRSEKVLREMVEENHMGGIHKPDNSEEHEVDSLAAQVADEVLNRFGPVGQARFINEVRGRLIEFYGKRISQAKDEIESNNRSLEILKQENNA